MENKELPQEIVIKMREFIQSEMAHKCTAIAQTYYNSIIEGKDKEIVEKNSHIANLLTEKVANIFMIAHQKAEIGELEAAHEKSEHTLWLTVMAKDGTIEELQEQANKQQQIITELLTQKQQEITAKQAEIERITELLKEQVKGRTREFVLKHGFAGNAATEYVNEQWDIYKKEHNL